MTVAATQDRPALMLIQNRHLVLRVDLTEIVVRVRVFIAAADDDAESRIMHILINILLTCNTVCSPLTKLCESMKGCPESVGMDGS